MITYYSRNRRAIYSLSLHSKILRSQNLFVFVLAGICFYLSCYLSFLQLPFLLTRKALSLLEHFSSKFYGPELPQSSPSLPDCFFLKYLTFHCQSKIQFFLPCPGICPLTWEKFSRDPVAFYIYNMFLGIIFIVNITL